jgi:uncharacterized RDD family membrane protein YckC
MSAPRVREIVTPEGVPVRFVVARAGDRLGAFLIDAFLIVAACAVLVLLAIPAATALPGATLAVGLLAFFLLRNFYFTYFECRTGSTPGKKVVGLRVIDAHGGLLTAEAVFARNLMREIELFLPLVALLAPGALLPDVPGWLRLPSLAWLLVFALLPFFNHDRLRVGDLVGGTMVVRKPEVALRRDLSAAAPRPRRGEEPPRFAFTAAQLDLYGITQLQLLEKILRDAHRHDDALEPVAGRIQRKIGWTAPPGPPAGAEEFLRAFYSAQRARLEQRLLLGERRQDKRAGRLNRTP